jgi:hypothetical protein
MQILFMILIVNNQYIIRIIQLYAVLTKGISYYIYKSLGKISCHHKSAIYSYVYIQRFINILQAIGCRICQHI